jgi:CubicO group peptidase (beta-lactamase class C family)
MKQTLALVVLVLAYATCRGQSPPIRGAGRQPDLVGGFLPSRLTRTCPEAQGVPSSAILAFVEEADKKVDSMHSFMLLRHGYVIAECWWAPYDPKTRHELYSLSKSFTSTAVGLAVAEGKLSIDDPVLKFFPEDAPAQVSNNLKSMRVQDLLRMSTGHQTEPSLFRSKDTWVKTFLAHPVPNKPGTHFLYNTAGTYMQSAIVQKATGQTVLEFLQRRLFQPLGIEGHTWGTSPQGITLGGYGLSIKTEDIAKFGQLYLQKGRWENKQLVPAAWVRAATSLETSNGSNPQSDWDQGYGYQFWRCRHNAYRGDGAFGQFCVVMPDQDAVVAITSGTKDLQGVLNLVWDKLLPAFSGEALTIDESAKGKLERKLAGLTLPVQTGSESAKMPKDISGNWFTFPTNDQEIEDLGLEICTAPEAATLLCKVNGHEQRLPVGVQEWLKGRLAFGNFQEQPVAASGAWTEDNVFTAKLCFYETPFTVTLHMDFSEGKLKAESSQNVGFGPTKKGPLIGVRK